MRFRSITTTVVKAAVISLCCTTTSAAVAVVEESTGGLNFLAIGDWGGVGSELPWLSNWLHPTHQTDVAGGMARVARELDSQFVIALGDNFYYRGVGGAHPYRRIQETFEEVYRDSGSGKWYVIAGNHDHYGNVTDQIQYTYHSRRQARNDKSHVHRWEFPSLYHKRTFTQGNLSVELILVDTVGLLDAFPKWYRWLPAWRRRNKVAASTKQWDWLKQSLQQSTADYLLVGGHFPVFSQGEHGPTAELVENLKPLLEQYGAHYLSGHDHAMMHYRQSGSPGVNYIVTGTGNVCCAKRRNKHQTEHEHKHKEVPLVWHLFQQDDPHGHVKGGFVSFQANARAMKIRYHDQAGNVLYEPNRPIRPRSQGAGWKNKHAWGSDPEEADLE